MTDFAQIKCSWHEIKDKVLQNNPIFYSIIENDKRLIPNELTILKYSFGQQVGDESFFYYPDNQKSKRMPFCMVLENHFEMYMELNTSLSPWHIYKPGQVFPYTKFLRANFLYEPSDMLKMTAGVRNSFVLLNKFSDKKNHAILKKYFKLTCEPPKSYEEQFTIFKGICDYAKPDWSACLLAFPKSWEEKAYKSADFVSYLNSIAYMEHLFKRNSLFYDYLLNTIILKHRIITNGFIKEVIKNLFAVACGDQSAYAPSLCEKNAPISFLRNIYINNYRSESTPIFMIPHKLTPFESQETVYYSLNKDAFLFKPNQFNNLNKLSQEIKAAFINICKEIELSNIASNTIFYKCTSNIELDINHRWNVNGDDTISDTLSFFKDPNIELQNTVGLGLPVNAQFLTGCFSLKYINQYEVHKK
ncbi:hypothetical protein ELY21_02330 [Legionella sp. km535]|uniref:hypothetical protein n=1 Tax=Legionella sp. km535 TaxID=2498107 RepID=UPI000F8D3499|nr:hypothetical protein [Legionella sp. km535]RUR19915.1 hypothetical protein ELY21_02330 [Legionella sp. km535]